MKKYISLILLTPTFLLLSCDPGFGVILQNHSKKPINVKIITDNGYIALSDSIDIVAKITSDFTQHEAVRITRPPGKSNYYSFTLKESHSAKVDYGRNSPDKDFKIIINSKDTLTVDSPEHDTEGNSMSTKHIFRITK